MSSKLDCVDYGISIIKKQRGHFAPSSYLTSKDCYDNQRIVVAVKILKLTFSEFVRGIQINNLGVQQKLSSNFFKTA